jgi:myotubularin-related protein 5/13
MTIEDKRGSLNTKQTSAISDDDNIYPGGSGISGGNSSGGGAGRNTMTQRVGLSIFDFIERQHTKSSLFYNFMYTPDPDRLVLRPQSSLSVLELWNYYIDEEMAQGPPYDPELVGNDLIDDDEYISGGAGAFVGSGGIGGKRLLRRKIINAGYDSLEKSDPGAFTRLLEELKQAETERGLLPQKWRQVWDKLELPHSDSLTRHASFSSALVRSHGRLQHKRSTLEIIMRGRLVGSHQESFSHPHRFEKHAYTTPTYCNHCGSVLWGPVRNGLRCMDCGNSYHEKCADSVPKNCTKYKAVEGVQQTLARNQGDNCSVSSSVNTVQTSSQHFYEQFSSNVAENRTHEG